jgi:PLP dependent protein
VSTNRSTEITQNLAALRRRLPAHAALIAVSKTKPASDVIAAAAAGQRLFGENYVQEALLKQAELHASSPDVASTLEWHFIGPLQSNKCREIAENFDWLHTLDRAKLAPLLASARSKSQAKIGTRLNVLIQVNIDAETTKSGCAVAEIADLARLILSFDSLALRGLMAIPNPAGDLARSFAAMQRCFHALQTQIAAEFPQASALCDSLSMGMSDDFELACAHGATLVRVGSGIFGAR